VVGGASGFLGRALLAHARGAGREVVTVGRGDADVGWSDADGIVRAVDGAELVVGLSGRSVDCRYTPANREEILRSRLETTAALRTAIGRAQQPPALWANSSTGTIYRHADDQAMTEASGEHGEGFSVAVAEAWEAEFFADALPGTRRVALRTAIVLGRGGALVPLVRLARLGLGGPQHDGRWPVSAARRAAGTAHRFRATAGRQWFSWIHLDDVVRAIDFLEMQTFDGPVNLSSPNPVQNHELMATLRRIVGAPFGAPQPRWLLELGAAMIGTETELVLKSRRVVPERLEESGFRFAYPTLEPALRSIVRGPSPGRARGRGAPALPRSSEIG
jgi:NAD dependent epimerase/dehydratase family enzyme